VNKCEFCKWYGDREYDYVNPRDECKRHAPIAIQSSSIGRIKTMWPQVASGESCGDFDRWEENENN
jgi:hypothetical protein